MPDFGSPALRSAAVQVLQARADGDEVPVPEGLGFGGGTALDQRNELFVIAVRLPSLP